MTIPTEVRLKPSLDVARDGPEPVEGPDITDITTDADVRLKPDATSVADATVRLADLTTIKVGDTASCEVDVTTELVERFAALSGDVNALHLSAPVAGGYGFERPVAHGMLALSAISRLIGTELPGHGSLWVSQDVRFSAPVLAGDRIRATVTVEQVSVAAGLVALKTEAVNLASQKTVISGTARVRVFPPPASAEASADKHSNPHS